MQLLDYYSYGKDKMGGQLAVEVGCVRVEAAFYALEEVYGHLLKEVSGQYGAGWL